MTGKRIYLDYNATAPANREVCDHALQYLRSDFGNPSSLYKEGQRARAALNKARTQLAGVLRCEERELIFTSGATEALNHALMRFFYRFGAKGGRILTTQVEHLAVLEPCRFLESKEWHVDYLPVDHYGRVNPGDIKKALRSDTRLISIIHAHNETGTLQPIEEIGRIAREARIPLLVDTVQSLGKVPVNLTEWGVSFAVFSAHKIGGFKGTGLLYAHRDEDNISFIHGGHQERGQRGGTENVSGIVAFAEAAVWAEKSRVDTARRLVLLRDRLEQGILNKFRDARALGHPTERLPNTSYMAFEHIESEKLLMSFDLAGISVSNGSACNSGSVEPSHVVKAMNVPEAFRRGTVRFSLGPDTTEEEIDRTLRETIRIIRHLQGETRSC